MVSLDIWVMKYNDYLYWLNFSVAKVFSQLLLEVSSSSNDDVFVAHILVPCAPFTPRRTYTLVLHPIAQGICRDVQPRRYRSLLFFYIFFGEPRGCRCGVIVLKVDPKPPGLFWQWNSTMLVFITIYSVRFSDFESMGTLGAVTATMCLFEIVTSP